MAVEVKVENLTKRFGSSLIWEDVSLTLPPGEISVLLGPSGTGKSVFLKHMVGLLRPNNGHIWIKGKDVCTVPESDLYEIRKLFGVLFQDGALFGSQNLFDNIAFPLREHTKKSESEIKSIVLEKLALVGMSGAEDKLPGEISGGMKKRAGLARALVLDPQILLFDEPDSGLDPVRTAYLDQLIVDINAVTGATSLIVTHNINTARTVPDNIGLLYKKHLAMFGPRHQLLTSSAPVVLQFMNGRKKGPIGMSEEKDAGEQAKEEQEQEDPPELPPVEPQLLPSWPLVRRSMSSPHGSHQFLTDPEVKKNTPVGAKFGENGIEPSEAPPGRPLPPREFLESIGVNPDDEEERTGQKEPSGNKGQESDGGGSQGQSDGQSTGSGGSSDDQTLVGRGAGPETHTGAMAAAAGATVALHKARAGHEDADETRVLPTANGAQDESGHDHDGRPRPTPDGRPRPRPTPYASDRPRPDRPRPRPTPDGEREPATSGAPANGSGSNGTGSNGAGSSGAPGSRRGVLASLLRRGERS